MKINLVFGYQFKRKSNPVHFRYWSNRNPHWLLDINQVRKEGVMTWAGVIDTHVIGPYFFEGPVNTDSYLELLEDFVIPELQALDYDLNTVWFQQDGAPAHRSNDTRHWLNDHFVNWIGIGGPVSWPTRSPDLNPLDFFVWPNLKRIINRIRPATLDALRELVQENIQAIEPASFERTLTNLEYRMIMCQANEGGHFEHLL